MIGRADIMRAATCKASETKSIFDFFGWKLLSTSNAASPSSVSRIEFTFVSSAVRSEVRGFFFFSEAGFLAALAVACLAARFFGALPAAAFSEVAFPIVTFQGGASSVGASSVVTLVVKFSVVSKVSFSSGQSWDVGLISICWL